MTAEREAALVTGASSGIGLELARIFARHGNHLVVVARRAEKLEALKEELESDFGIEVKVLVKDLSRPDAPREIYDELQENGIRVGVLVNNAGMSVVDSFQAADTSDIMSMVQVNVVALTEMTKLFVGPMVERGRGRILNVASVVSYYPTPRFATYGASKAFILSLTEALSEDLKGTGVTATVLCPGYTKTEMIADTMNSSGLERWDRFIPSVWKMDASKVAKEGYRACMKGRSVHVSGVLNQVATEWVRHQPKWLVRNTGGIMSRIFTPAPRHD